MKIPKTVPQQVKVRALVSASTTAHPPTDNRCDGNGHQYDPDNQTGVTERIYTAQEARFADDVVEIQCGGAGCDKRQTK